MIMKYDCFEVILDVLFQKEKPNIKDFTTLKVLKLLFFISCISSQFSKDKNLLNIFNRFVAMPYGPVESDIYNKIQADELKKYRLTTNECIIKDNSASLNVDESTRHLIKQSITKLIAVNPNILSYSAFQLVDLSHKWSCWQICFKVAKDNNKSSIIMPINVIESSTKYYNL